MSSLPETVTTREAAGILGVALRTAQLWVESGVLEAWKTPGGHRRITRRSIEKILAERARSMDPPASEPYTILIVEDDPALLKLFRFTLAGWDLPIRVVLAQNGYEGLMKIGEERPDMLVTDLRMPGIDGFEMIRTLRANAPSSLRIVVVTGMSPSDIATQGGLPGDVTVYPKPVPFEALRAQIESELSAKP